MSVVDSVFLRQSKDFAAVAAVHLLQGDGPDKGSPDPVVVVLLFILRCLVPLAIMLGVSYLLRKFGLIQEPSPPPLEADDGESEAPATATEGDLQHG